MVEVRETDRFSRRGAALVVLLAGGDKKSQAADIRTAQDLARLP